MSCSHEWASSGTIFLPHPLGPWRGVKRSNIIQIQLQSQFQRGGQKINFSEIQRCVSYSHEWHMQPQIFFGPRPLWPKGGAKRSNIIISITKSISKIFKPNFVCLLTNERYETYKTGFPFGRLGNAKGLGLGVGGYGRQKFNYLNMVIMSCGISN